MQQETKAGMPTFCFLTQASHSLLEKCDGTRPTCQQCIAHGRGLDCEYADPYTPTRSEILQDYLARLQQRAETSEAQDVPDNTQLPESKTDLVIVVDSKTND